MTEGEERNFPSHISPIVVPGQIAANSTFADVWLDEIAKVTERKVAIFMCYEDKGTFTMLGQLPWLS
jgi:hypothetical protein